MKLAPSLSRLSIRRRIIQILLLNAAVIAVGVALAWYGAGLFLRQSEHLGDLSRQGRRVETLGARCTELALMVRQHLDDHTPEARGQVEARARALGEDILALGREFPAMWPEASALAGAVTRLSRGFAHIREVDEALDAAFRGGVAEAEPRFHALVSDLRAQAMQRGAGPQAQTLDHLDHLSQLAASAAAALHLARDPREADQARRFVAEFRTMLTEVRRLPAMALPGLDQLERMAGELESAVAELEKGVLARQRILTDEVNGGQAAVAPAVERILTGVDRQVAAMRENVSSEVLRNAALSTSVAAALLAISVWLSWAIARSITRPLARLMGDVRRLAPENAPFQPEGDGDEVAALAEAMGAALRLRADRDALLGEQAALIARYEAERDRADRTLGELKRANEELTAIFVNSLVGIACFDSHGRLLKANRRLADIFGFSEGELTSLGAADFHRSEEEYRVFREMYYNRLGQEDLLQVEIPLRQKDGAPIWCQISAKLIDPATPGRGLIVVFDDVTGKKKVREELGALNRHLEQLVLSRTRDLAEKAKELEAKAAQLEEANLRLRELDRLKSDFLSSVSHELRTPLTSIMGFARLIQREFGRALDACRGDICAVPLDKARRLDQNLDIMVQESRRLTEMINDVLDLTRIEDGRMNWNDAILIPARAVERAARSAAGMFAEKPALALAYSAAPDLPPISADADRVHQVLMNLLSNAAKFTDRGAVTLSARSDNGGVRFSVSDQGVGVPPEELERIFDKFHQSSQGDILRNKVKGAGLGLPICKEIVLHYGGRIWAESLLGEGSVFHVYFPAAH